MLMHSESIAMTTPARNQPPAKAKSERSVDEFLSSVESLVRSVPEIQKLPRKRLLDRTRGTRPSHAGQSGADVEEVTPVHRRAANSSLVGNPPACLHGFGHQPSNSPRGRGRWSRTSRFHPRRRASQ